MVVDFDPRSDGNAPLSVGVVGAGHIARSFHLPILANIERVRIEFVADLDIEKAEQLTTTYEGRPIATDNAADLPNCDVLLLTVPVGVREEYVDAFGERGTAIFSEKPFAITLAHHDRLEESAPEIVCNFMRLNFQSTRHLRFLVQSGILGKLERITATEGEIVGATGKGEGHYQTDGKKSGGGVLIQNGCHLLSQLVYILGNRDFTVETCQVKCHGSFDIDVDAELEFSGDVPVDVRISQIRNLPNRLELTFERATVAIDPGDPEAMVDVSAELEDEIKRVTLEPHSHWATNLVQAHYIRWRSFFNWIGGEETEPPLRTGRCVTELIGSMYDRGDVDRDL